MQFHLNGYRIGDPEIAPANADIDDGDNSEKLPKQVDVLIVGCGPAGLTLAAQLAVFPDIKTCIIDQKTGPLVTGQADGVACRTIEMFEAFGFAEKVVKEAYWVNETAFWKPDENQPENIARSGRIQDTEDGLSAFPHVILNQARVHDFLLLNMSNGPRRLAPHYARQLVDMKLGTDVDDLVSITVKRLDDVGHGEHETISARYVVGCDGARSVVRQKLGRALVGESANSAWGVMDVLAVSDFPDIRLKSVIHSASEGNILIIPREGGYMVRLYIELDKLKAGERISNRNLSVDDLISAAQRILHPYKLEVKEVAWWSVYEIGQRLCDKFDDGLSDDAAIYNPQVFIAGDACHTHSPKAGQGMNVSMADSFNLGWKLASVINENSSPEILRTYSDERQGVAKELIDFDRAFAKMFSARPKASEGGPQNGDEQSIDPKVFQKYFEKQGRFTAGTAVQYSGSLIQGAPDFQHLATAFEIGMRFHSAPVIRLADAKPMQLGHTIKADGRWRIFAFTGNGDVGQAGGALARLCDYLGNDKASPLKLYARAGADVDSIIDVRAIFQNGHRDLMLGEMPELARPKKGRLGLVDYEKAFCPDMKNQTDIFDLRGIDRKNGCVVIVRPDQYVAHILPLDGYEELSAFFDGFMLTR